jgi:hypothetical protein
MNYLVPNPSIVLVVDVHDDVLAPTLKIFMDKETTNYEQNQRIKL